MRRRQVLHTCTAHLQQGVSTGMVYKKCCGYQRVAVLRTCKTGTAALKLHHSGEVEGTQMPQRSSQKHSLDELVNNIWACGRTVKTHGRGCQDMQSERRQKMLSRFFIILYNLYGLVCLVYHIHANSSFCKVSLKGNMV